MNFTGGKGRRRSAGRELYVAAVSQARRPAFYAEMAAPDTVEGRFELLNLHVVLLVDRLSGEGRVAAQTSQALFDAYVSDLDAALREMGVGDLSVGKRMRELGRAFYGRAAACHEAFAALPDQRPLRSLVERTILDGRPGANGSALAGYLARARRALAAQDLETLLTDGAAWPSA